ncbi:biopolymer transporter ExbD [Propionivibrio limicola]|uniref:biopolymer transporter ExbD n=1 Tax=Propionivibrio limicola TaxID=167645 RepID=UPI0012919797|nr:biopolymer transporter ExbD [Propionivibrio limicola]
MRPRRLKNEINVVPYIDVMLVLLVIFMVTAPMMNTASIDVPSAGKTKQAPMDAIYLNIDADKAFSLTENGKTGGQLSETEAFERIADAMDKNAEQPVLINADKNLKYEVVVHTMDALRKQNVKNVSLLVQTTGK